MTYYNTTINGALDKPLLTPEIYAIVTEIIEIIQLDPDKLSYTLHKRDPFEPSPVGP